MVLVGRNGEKSTMMKMIYKSSGWKVQLGPLYCVDGIF